MLQIEVKQATQYKECWMGPWGHDTSNVVTYQFVLAPPVMSLGLSPWRRVVERLIGQLTSGACALTGPAVPLSGTDGKCAAERNAFI